MKYAFIQQHQKVIPVKDLCKILNVSRSAYYRWKSVGISQREQANQALLPLIQQIHQYSRKVYGSPRIYNALRQHGIGCSRNRIARIMHNAGIRAKTVRRYKITTRSRVSRVTTPDFVQRNFSAPKPNYIWTTDITYVWTKQGWAYLAVVLDLFSRMIVGWELSTRLSTSLVTESVKRALFKRAPSERLILHSDRGSQYTSTQLQEFAKEHNIQLSMGRTGSCYDNAVTESFFHTLKTEHLSFHRYETRLDARTSIFDYIETFYNQHRLHSTIGYRSPMQYELESSFT
jgi:transposase InsO family protein